MTVSEHLEQTGFAYDAEFPPDCEAGKPLASVREAKPAPPVKRALKGCARLVLRRR